jgi:plastocyanin
MRFRLVLASLCLAISAPALAGAEDAPPSAMVVATAAHYLPGDQVLPLPVLPVVRGTGVQFANADFTPHSLESVDRDARGRPIFDSGMLYFGQLAPVAGVEALAPGTYQFYCYAHPSSMRGALLVLATPA